MNLLALDTATDLCALACSVDGVVTQNTRSIPRLHNEQLLPMLDELLREANLSPRELSAIAFAAGPGSFTGIRISAAVAQALAVAAGAFVVPVSSSVMLVAAAQRLAAQRHAAGASDPVLGFQTVLRSRRNFAYLASFDAKGVCLSDDCLYADEDIQALALPAGWMRVMQAAGDDAAAVGAQSVTATLADLLAYASSELAAGNGLPPEGAQPRYVEGEYAVAAAHLTDNLPRLAVFCAGADQKVVAGLLAGQPELVLAPAVNLADADAVRLLLDAQHLDRRFALVFQRDELRLARADRRGRFDTDSCALAMAEFNRRAGQRTELQRAVLSSRSAAQSRAQPAAESGEQITVLDGFAGWGMDALSLASAGARVFSVERQPALCALLRDALRRVPVSLAERVQVRQGSAQAVLADLEPGAFDLVYLDPMFPARKKGALPNKRLQFLSELCDDAPVDLTGLLALAQPVARREVVLKRRRRDPVHGNPSRQVLGASVRYDIYSAAAH